MKSKRIQTKYNEGAIIFCMQYSIVNTTWEKGGRNYKSYARTNQYEHPNHKFWPVGFLKHKRKGEGKYNDIEVHLEKKVQTIYS